MVETLALGTITNFSYEPVTDDIKKIVAAKTKKPFKSLPDNFAGDASKKESNLPKDPKALEALKKHYEDARRELIEIEEKRPWIKKQTKGDASETGIVKFIQPLLNGDN